MKTRYYLFMLSVFLVVILYDVVYIIVCAGRGYTFSGVVVDAVVFLGLNLIGIYYLYKPIDKFMRGEVEFDEVRRKIAALPFRSTLWVCVLGCIYYSWFFGVLLKSALGLTPLRYASIAGGLFLGYFLFPGFYIFFVINNYIIDLKEYIHKRFGFIFPPERIKFWQKLLGSYVVVSVLPIAFIVLDMASVESWEKINPIFRQDIVTDVASVFLCIGVAVYFITRGLTRPVDLLTDSLERVGDGDYSVKTPVVSDDEIGILTADFNAMVEGLGEREFIRDTFGRYVAKEVAAEILRQRVKFAGEEQLVTILFTDIAGYTTISESLTPQEVVEMLNDYFSQVVDVVVKHKGIVNKFIGDAIMAFFNVPLKDPEHAQNAVRAALEIERLSNERRFGKGVRLKTRVGVNTGIVVAGSIGSEDRLEYTVIGDAVNVAARLEQLNKQYGTQVLVGHNTFELARDDFDFERIGDIKLKGKHKPLDVYKVWGRMD